MISLCPKYILVAGLQVVPLPPSFPLQIHRSTLELVEPSIAPSTIIVLKTTEIPLVLRAQGHPLVSAVPVSPSKPSIAHQNLSPLTANEYRDSASGWDSMAGVDSRAWGDLSTLELVEPSIAPSTITDIKTAGIPLNLRTQESPGASLNAWGIGESSLVSLVRLESGAIYRLVVNSLGSGVDQVYSPFPYLP
jgi:hypothetical protein